MEIPEEQPIHILHLEDQEDDADLIRRALRKGGIAFESVRVDTRDEFERALDARKPDIILSDHSMPQFNSVQALRIKTVKAPEVPFILVTGAVSEEFAAQCIKLGANDYILKSNLSRLPSAVNQVLEHTRTERMRVVGERALQEQNIKLARAQHEIDSFVYSVSHNLRSPLASVLGLVDLARKARPEEMPNYLNMMEKSVHKLDDTIKEILDYSQNERNEINTELIDLGNLITEALDKLKYLRGFADFARDISVSADVPFYSDRFRVSIILINLLSNAIKYQDDTKAFKLLEIKVSVTTEFVTIHISDNGIGIPADRLPYIFNMFYRGTDRSDGAGLGLYIAKAVSEKLGGSIDVVPEPQAMTNFRVTLPNR